MPAGLAPDITGYVAKMDALAPLMSSVKTVFGWSCFIGAAVLLVFLLYGVEPVRRMLKKMPSWKSVGRNDAQTVARNRIRYGHNVSYVT